MGNLVERIAKAPVGVKVAAVLIGLIAVSGLNWFVVGVGLPPGRSIAAINAAKRVKEQELKDAVANLGMKRQIANDLNRFRRQRELLQQKFQEARAELPDSLQMDDLLQGLQEKAVRAGLVIAKVEPKPVIPAQPGEFYAKIPIALDVTGNFHEIATFFDALGHMQRIVNVTEIVLENPKDVNGRVILAARFIATTFMFDEPRATPAKPNAGRKVNP